VSSGGEEYNYTQRKVRGRNIIHLGHPNYGYELEL